MGYVAYAPYLKDTLENCLSQEVNYVKDIDELILIEHFTDTADKEIGQKIRDNKLKTLKEAPTWSGKISGFGVSAGQCSPVLPREDYLSGYFG